ncbi:methyl-accepting chemotaxis protein [Xylophilus sp. GW821-FHT01B05]
MKFNDIRVSHKLWGGILGLLVIMLAISLWSQQRASALADEALTRIRAYDDRITTAVQWRGAIETVGDRVMASNASADSGLVALFDTRVKAGVAGISALQDKVVAQATSPAEKAALQRIAAERAAVLELNKKARELQLASASAAVSPEFVQATYLPAIGRYVAAMDDFVKLQEQARDAAVAQMQAERSEAAFAAVAGAVVVLLAGIVLAAVLVRAMSQPLAHAVQVAESIAAGDLSLVPDAQRRDEFGQLLAAQAAMVRRLRGVVGEVRGGVESVSTASAEIAHGNQDLSARTEQAASSLQQTAASMEQLTGTVSQAASTAQQARQLASSAAQAATRGGEVVGQVVASMEQISNSSRRIGDIIGTIDGIAFQTNILALNAAVEAARAGEQGRGFAVVAAEVRSLAQRSAQAAREIKGLIGASVDTVDTGSRQVTQAGTAMGEIVHSVRQVADLIAEIHASATEQRDGIGQVNQAVNQLDQMTQQNAALVEESAAAASSLRDQAQRLSEVIAVFKLDAGASVPMLAVAKAPVLRSPAAITREVLATARAPHKPAPVKAIAAAAPAAVAASKEEDWETF